MSNQEAYNQWSATYDTVINKTRDLEAIALQTVLSAISFSSVIEIGCGTGKNTAWLIQHAKDVTAVDFSKEMLSKAKEKMKSETVHFIETDITMPWRFTEKHCDLVTCSLILEHINDIEFIFKQAYSVLLPGGFFYLGELHPFKQYIGSKARFNKEDKTVILDCFIHHLSDYLNAAKAAKMECADVNEWFDENDHKSIPRLITMLFRKNR